MPKIDPKGEVENPIKVKLAHEVARPIPVVLSPLPRAIHPVTDDSVVEPLTLREKQPNEEVISTKLAKMKKVLFTVAEQQENNRVVQQIGEAIGSDTLAWSHINRAMWVIIRRAQDKIEQRKKHTPKLIRPSNGNPIELAKFEDSLADYLLTIFKEVPRR